MPGTPATTPAPVPIPAADPLFAETLRAALELYLRGDYLHAASYLLDASCVGGGRPESYAWKYLGDAFEGLVSAGALQNHDAQIPRESQVRR